jgi:hypothetical protein
VGVSAVVLMAFLVIIMMLFPLMFVSFLIVMIFPLMLMVAFIVMLFSLMLVTMLVICVEIAQLDPFGDMNKFGVPTGVRDEIIEKLLQVEAVGKDDIGFVYSNNILRRGLISVGIGPGSQHDGEINRFSADFGDDITNERGCGDDLQFAATLFGLGLSRSAGGEG